MASLTRYGLTLEVDHATPDNLERGLRVANQIFEKANVRPREAARAAFDLEQSDPAFGGHPILPAARERAFAWMDACEAAIKACCGGREPPAGWQISLADRD
jgi:hypothetical protein